MEKKSDTSEEISDQLFLKVFELSTGSLIIKADVPHYTIIAAGNDFLESFSVKREEITGKGFAQLFWDKGNSTAASILSNAFNKVITTKGKVEIPVYSCELMAKKDTLCLAAINVPVLGDDGEVSHIIHTPVNITAQILLKQKDEIKLLNLKIQQEQMSELFMKAPVGVTFLSKDNFIIEYANHAICEMWNRGGPEVIVGKPAFEIAVEVADFRKTMERVIRTGIPFIASDAPVLLNRNNKAEIYYFDLIFDPFRDSENQITGIIGIAVEVTDKVKSKQLLLDSEQRFRNLIIDAPVAISVLKGSDLVVESVNHIMLELWGKPDNIIGKPLIDALPELEGQSFIKLLRNVYITGLPYYGYEAQVTLNRKGKNEDCYFNFVYQPLKETGGNITGVMVVATEVTEQIIAKHALEDAEERLRLATEATGLGTWDLDLKKTTMIHSPKLAEIFGQSGDVVMTQQDFRKFIHPDDMHIVLYAFNKALQTGKYFYEVRVILPGGSIHWVRNMGRVIYDDMHQPLRMLGTLNDVTTQRNLIDELKASEENLRLATQAAELGTFDMDLLKGTMDWDTRCRELFGIYSYRPVTYEQDFLPALHPDDRERIAKSIEQLMDKKASNGDYNVEYRTIGFEDEKVRWIKARGKVSFDENDVPVRFMGAVLDITENKLDEIRKNDFIAMASHELKTPLTSLKSYIQLLLLKAEKLKDEFLINSLQKSENQVNKMTSLIYGFLDLSKIESGKLELNRQMFDINDLIKEVIADSAPIAPEHTLLFEADGAIRVNADKEKISQVMMNFISNAVKYSPKGSKITISSKTEEKAVRIVVKDEGIGINKKHQKNIFERFYRVEDESTRGFSGFGIGLYISAEIIQLHHGKIGVKSEEDKGAAFYFTLPMV